MDGEKIKAIQLRLEEARKYSLINANNKYPYIGNRGNTLKNIHLLGMLMKIKIAEKFDRKIKIIGEMNRYEFMDYLNDLPIDFKKYQQAVRLHNSGMAKIIIDIKKYLIIGKRKKLMKGKK